MNKTPIEWCRTYAADGTFREGHTVNPVRFRPRGSARLVTMCQKVSAGCAHCYAAEITRRFWPKDAEMPFPGYTALGVTSGEFELSERLLEGVLRHKGATRLFWGDMTDLFQDGVPDWMLDRIFAVCALTPHITHMFLTKRAQRMYRYFNSFNDATAEARGFAFAEWCIGKLGQEAFDRVMTAKLWRGLPNVWLGVSVEDQAQADARIPWLLKTPAAVRFLSCEPLLGPVRVGREILTTGDEACAECGCASAWQDYFSATLSCTNPECSSCGEALALGHIDWVIVGGESGGAKTVRPMHPLWARGLRDQCVAAGLPFFFKQWGAFAENVSPVEAFNHTTRNFETVPAGGGMVRVGKKAAVALLDGWEWREFPGEAAPGRKAGPSAALRSAQDDSLKGGE